MKSCIRPCTVSDGGMPSDREFERVELDFEELLQALQENAIDHLIREVLRPKYGDMLVFPSVVAEITHVVLCLLVRRLRQIGQYQSPMPGDVVVVQSVNEILNTEKQTVCRVTGAGMAYWKGESS